MEERERERERERESAHVCVYVCVCERETSGKKKTYGTQGSVFFLFGSTGGQRSQGSTKMLCPTAHPNKLTYMYFWTLYKGVIFSTYRYALTS